MDAKVEKIDDLVEEQVTLLADGVEIVCFAGVCPYPIEVGRTYPVSLTLDIFDDYDVHQTDDKVPSLQRIGKGFAYVLTGRLENDTLDAGIRFQDEIFLRDFAYLDGKMIEVKVDRINAEFLPTEE